MKKGPKILLYIVLFIFLIKVFKISEMQALLVIEVIKFCKEHYSDFYNGMTFIENDAEYCHLISC